mgnify:CR=1 FL=1
MREVKVTDPEIFETMWSGFMTPTQRDGYAGQERLNRVVNVLDHLEKISVEVEPDVEQLRDIIEQGLRTRVEPGKIAGAVESAAGMMRSARKLVEGGGAMIMDDEDHKALLQKLEHVEWTERAARRAARALALLRDAPKWTPPVEAEKKAD